MVQYTLTYPWYCIRKMYLHTFPSTTVHQWAVTKTFYCYIFFYENTFSCIPDRLHFFHKKQLLPILRTLIHRIKLLLPSSEWCLWYTYPLEAKPLATSIIFLIVVLKNHKYFAVVLIKLLDIWILKLTTVQRVCI